MRATKTREKSAEVTASPGEAIEGAILLIRGQRVILDADVAELYGVPTKVLVQAVAEALPPVVATRVRESNERRVSGRWRRERGLEYLRVVAGPKAASEKRRRSSWRSTRLLRMKPGA